MNSIYFYKIRTIVNEFDPCNLISNGAPPDEYDEITYRIMRHYQDKKPTAELRDLLINKIENYFGCLDLTSLDSENKSRFIKEIEIVLEKIEKELGS